MRISRLGCLAATATAICCAAATAEAQSTVKVGTLTCHGGAGVGMIVGSKKWFDCDFTPANGGTTEQYRATVTKIGIDVGITGNTTLVWTVLAPSQKYKPHVLRGNYVGAAADASLGLGAGAKVLVGGSNKTITLQPLSIQGQTGVNLAVGIADLALR